MLPCILKNSRQSRYYYRTRIGDPGPLFVLHRCDQPNCVELTHLFLGTARDNMQDCVRKGRMNTEAAHQASRKVRCKRGHPLRDPNLYYCGKQRWCKKCFLLRARRYREALR